MSLKVYPPRRATCSPLPDIDQFMSGIGATRPRSTARSGCSSEPVLRLARLPHGIQLQRDGDRPCSRFPRTSPAARMNARWTVGTASWRRRGGGPAPDFIFAAGIPRRAVSYTALTD